MKKLESSNSSLGYPTSLYQDGDQYFVFLSYSLHGHLHGRTNLYVETLLYRSDEKGNLLSMVPVMEYKKIVPEKKVIEDYENRK